MEWTICPECGGLAEVQWRDVVGSTSGPVPVGRILCVRRHTFLMPLPADEGAQPCAMSTNRE